MADFALTQDSRPPAVVCWLNAIAVGAQSPTNAWSVSAIAALVVTYKMRGMDALTAGLYDAWLVVGAPDPTGAYYTGTLHTPLRDIVVIDGWSS